MRMWELGDQMAEGATLMTGTTVESRVLGAAWPQHMNRPLAETVHANMLEVGLPKWSEADQRMAKAVQKMLGAEESGLATEVGEELRGREDIPDSQRRGGGSDDIGDISWVVPTVSLRFPSNIAGGQGHNWNKAIAMATPIAHKGATAGAKVFARTLLDILLAPGLVDDARTYFESVQKADDEYISFLRPEGRSRDLAERGDHGDVQAAVGAVLLRPVAVRHLPGAARDRVSDDPRERVMAS